MDIRMIAGWFIALLSIAGWVGLYVKKCRFVPELSLPLSVSTVTIITFICGIFGILKQGAWAAACAGCALFLYLVISDRKTYRAFLSPGFVFLAAFAVFIAWQVHDDRLSHNDDFNHWAVIVKNMLLRDSFPDSSVSAIDFSSYPPGSAVFIYFINRITMGDISEGRFIFAQNLMVLCLISPVFAVMAPKRDGEKDRMPVYAMLSACVLLMFLYEFRALVVDVLNGVVGFAAIAGVLYYRDEPKKAVLYAAPVTALGLLVKYSNVFYAGITLMILIWICIRSAKNSGKRIWMYIPAWFLPGIVCVAAWYVHVGLAYGGVADTHSMNLGRITDVMAGWSREDIKRIAYVCLRLGTSLSKSSVLLTVFMNAVTIGLAITGKLFFKRDMKRLVGAVCMADIAYIGYQIMLFCAYVLSFPREEALRGASYGRYNMSIMIFIIGFLSYVCVSEIRAIAAENENGRKCAILKYVFGTGFALTTLLALTVTGEGATLFNEVQYEGSWRAAADSILEDPGFEYDDDTRFLILAADPDSKQNSSVFHYLTNREVDHIYVGDIEDTAQLREAASEDDWVIVLDDDERIQNLIGGIGAYAVDELECE